MPASKPTIKYIVGLGNPGEEHSFTYHNVGFLALDHFLCPPDEEGCFIARGVASPWQTPSHKHFAYAETDIHTLVKPLTFMNRSGDAMDELLRYFNTDLAHISVIHDDFDLPIGTYKETSSSGSAGHKGIESIITTFNTQDFHRMRVGIRPLEDDFQLGKIKADQY